MGALVEEDRDNQPLRRLPIQAVLSALLVLLAACGSDNSRPRAGEQDEPAAGSGEEPDGMSAGSASDVAGSLGLAGSGGSGGASADAGSAGASGTGDGAAGDPMRPGSQDTGDIVPLYDAETTLEPDTLIDRGDAIVTRFADRARDRHAREDEFQSYDHYLPHYWKYRTVRVQFVDRVDKGGDSIDVAFISEWPLGPREFRAWYYGMGTVAHYSGNYAPQFQEEGPGTYDNDFEKISDEGTQYKYTYTIESAILLDGQHAPLAVGQLMEIEISQFLEGVPEGRENYYGTVFLYEVGKGGLVPWHAVGDFDDKSSERENSHKLDERAWTAGRTTLPYGYSDEPDNHFMQMATNLAPVNGQPFVRGRRVHHTDMRDGSHDESAENGIFDELVGIAGPLYVNSSCDGCHKRNGRAAPPEPGEPLTQWVFKVAAEEGESDPQIGKVLQPAGTGASGEGSVSIARWLEMGDGLRAPEYSFSGVTPARYSARAAPQLVGLGLLEAIDEATVLAYEDVDDADGDGISGKAQRAIDPVTGDTRLGRFGWKAGTSSLRHQIAAALNSDMGVMTSVLPEPDCGALQSDCGNDQGPELGDEPLQDLVKYVALLGVRARRDLDDPEALRGEEVFEELACSSCHLPELQTSRFHPFAELRDQTIHPYTDLLLHDMGEGLADNLEEGDAQGSEWRTTPLWGIGLSDCVTGGVEGPFQQQTCTPRASYLHDGRARTIEEAILWHGGEAQPARDGFASASEADKVALLAFLRSL